MKKRKPVEIAVIIFLGLYFTKLAWYDIRTIYPEQAQSLLSAFFIGYSIVLAPFIAYAFILFVGRIASNKLMLFFLFINVYGFIWGVANGNLNIYLIQDTFKLLFVPTGFLLAYMVYKRGGSFEVILLSLIKWAILFAIVRFMIHAYLHTNSSLVYGTVQDLLLIGNSFFQIFMGSSAFSSIMAVFVLMLVLAGQKRTLFVLAACAFLWALSVFSQSRKNITQVLMVFFTLLLIVGGLTTMTGSLNRVLGTSESVTNDIGKDSKRLREVLVVFDELAKDGGERFFSGFGSGAYFNDPVPNPITGYTTTHSVHFTPAAMVFRYGLFGLLLYVFCTLYLLKLSIIRMHGINKNLAFVMRFYMLGAIVMSLVTYGVVDDAFLGFVIGAILFSNKQHKAHEGTSLS